MKIEINFKNRVSDQSTGNLILFVDEKFNIAGLKKVLVNNEYSYISDLIKSEDLTLLKKEWMEIPENNALDTRGNGMYSAGFTKLNEYANYKKSIRED